VRRALAPRRLDRLRFHHPRVAETIESVARERLTYLELPALLDLAEAGFALERGRLAGSVIEAGSAYGGSAIVLASAKDARRPLRVYDVFGEFPSPSERDAEDAHRRHAEIASGAATWSDDRPFYGYVSNLAGEVRASFTRYGLDPEANSIELIQGLIEQTLAVEGPVALAHVDCDWYDPVVACLERICPHLVPGGRVIVDDYDDWQGARRAVDEFLGWNPTLRVERRSRLHIVNPG
jgi:hypothetical protein